MAILNTTNINASMYTPVFKLPGGNNWAFDIDWTSSAFAAKTFTGGLASGLVVDNTGGGGGKLTFASDTYGAAQNYIKIKLTAGGTAGAETVGVTGTGVVADPYIIDVTIETTVSTAAQIKTALDNDVTAAALINTTVTTAGAMAAIAATSMTGGADPDINTTNGNIAIAAHGYITGTKVVFTKGGASAPTGLTDSATYYAIVISSSVIRLASSYANAMAGTAIVPSDYGSPATNTLTPATADAAFKLQASVEGDVWYDITGATQALTTTGTKLFDSNFSANYPKGVGCIRGVITVTDGAGAVLAFNARAISK